MPPAGKLNDRIIADFEAWVPRWCGGSARARRPWCVAKGSIWKPAANSGRSFRRANIPHRR